MWEKIKHKAARGTYHLKAITRYPRISVTIYVAILLVTNVFIYRFSTDLIIVSLIILAMLMGQSKQFVKDWWLPVVLFFVYEQARAQAANYGLKLGVHLWNEEIIWLEEKVFFFMDKIPPVAIQRWLRPEIDVLHWYDYTLFFFYIMFFWYWFAIGYLIWTKKRELFKKYIYGLLGFSFFDTFIYFVAPTAPPWWAAQHGFIEPIQRILWTSAYLPSDAIQYVHTYGVNDFAAIPSHHAAWPFFATLFLIKIYGKKALPFLLIPFFIAFATWFGAEHYVVDSLLGWLVAGLTYVIVINWEKIIEKLTIFHKK